MCPGSGEMRPPIELRPRIGAKRATDTTELQELPAGFIAGDELPLDLLSSTARLFRST